jgi:hypothetical protein
MAHLEYLNFSTIDGQQEFVREVNNFRFPHTGPLRTGFIRPYVSEWRMYDIRIPDDKASQCVTRIHTWAVSLDGMKMSKDNIRSGAWFIRLGLKIARMFTPFQGVKPDKTVPEFQYKNWQYSFLIGKLKDPLKQSEGTKVWKEVM